MNSFSEQKRHTHVKISAKHSTTRLLLLVTWMLSIRVSAYLLVISVNSGGYLVDRVVLWFFLKRQHYKLIASECPAMFRISSEKYFSNVLSVIFVYNKPMEKCVRCRFKIQFLSLTISADNNVEAVAYNSVSGSPIGIKTEVLFLWLSSYCFHEISSTATTITLLFIYLICRETPNDPFEQIMAF